MGCTRRGLTTKQIAFFRSERLSNDHQNSDQQIGGENPHQPVFLSLQDAAPSSPLELCLGLEIFQELNLIKVSYEDILIKIDILSSEKNPLVNSPLYRSLWNMD